MSRLRAFRGASAVMLVSLVLTIAAVPAGALARPTDASASCRLEGGSLDWGIKGEFRNYILGSKANGQWIASGGATFHLGAFHWRSASGNYGPGSGVGLVGFVGSVTFTGRAGVLTKTLSNPELQFVDPRHAFLLFDVDATTSDGGRVDTPGVQFARLDLARGTPGARSPGLVGARAVPATLTRAGAAAFGYYADGERLDPVRYQLRYPASCPEASSVAPVAPVDRDAGGLALLVLALGVLAIGAVVVLVLVRRRQQ